MEKEKQNHKLIIFFIVFIIGLSAISFYYTRMF